MKFVVIIVRNLLKENTEFKKKIDELQSKMDKMRSDFNRDLNQMNANEQLQKKRMRE